MKIAIPRERKNGETRVALTPEQARELIRLGHEVFIEQGAGQRSFYPDEHYRQAGARLVPTLADLWAEAELLVKVKEPAPEEFSYFRSDLTVFSFLHPAAFPEMTNALVQAGCTALSYDLLQAPDGSLPLLRPMSIIAGTLAVYAGSNALLSDRGGRGTLLSTVCGIEAGSVLIIGGGSAGAAAASTAAGVGARTTILDVNAQRVAELQRSLPQVRSIQSSAAQLEALLPEADLIIGAVLVPGDTAPKIISRSRLALIKAGSAFVDISIDQGGCAESSRPTSISDPTYIDSQVVHYCVPNMPALAAQTATRALTAETFPYILRLAAGAVVSPEHLNTQEAATDQALRSALVCRDKQLIHPVVAAALAQQ